MKDMRMQARGIILHKDFDSVIIGTSMLENTSAKEANKKLGGKWMNLSLSGSTFAERFIVLNYLFKHKNIDNIIYSIDIRELSDTKEAKRKNFILTFDDNKNNDFSLYLSTKFITCALTFSKKEECIGVKNLETLTNWYEKHKNKFGGIENWDKQYTNKIIKNSILNAKNFQPNFNIDILDFKNYIKKYLLEFIKNHPNIQFHLVIPTYSRITYRIFYENSDYYNTSGELFSNHYAITNYLIQETNKYPNVKIYGFDDLAYADDIKNYRDLTHYNTDMNSMQLDAIKNGTHILTPQNMDKYFKIMEEKIRNYDLSPFVEFIKNNG